MKLHGRTWSLQTDSLCGCARAGTWALSCACSRHLVHGRGTLRLRHRTLFVREDRGSNLERCSQYVNCRHENAEVPTWLQVVLAGRVYGSSISFSFLPKSAECHITGSFSTLRPRPSCSPKPLSRVSKAYRTPPHNRSRLPRLSQLLVTLLNLYALYK